MGTLSTTFSVMGSSWAILKKDKEIIFFSMLSGLYLSVLFIGWGALMIHAFPEGLERMKADPFSYGWEPYAYAFLLYLGIQLISSFFNGAIVASAARRLSGGDPTVSSGFSDAFKHLPSIFIWAFISAFFVMLLDLVRSKKGLGRWISGAMRMAASVATFFVLPFIMIEGQMPIRAIASSVALIKKTWGEQVIGNLSFSLLFFLINIPGLVSVFYGLFQWEQVFLRWAGIGAGSLYLVISVSACNSLSEIFRTVLYFYIRDGKTPEGFEASVIQSAFRTA